MNQTSPRSLYLHIVLFPIFGWVALFLAVFVLATVFKTELSEIWMPEQISNGLLHSYYAFPYIGLGFPFIIWPLFHWYRLDAARWHRVLASIYTLLACFGAVLVSWWWLSRQQFEYI